MSSWRSASRIWRSRTAASAARKVGGDREVAPLVELRRRQPRPVAVDPAAVDRAAHHPDDVAVAVVGAAIAVLAHGAAELGEDDDHRVAPGAAEPAGQRGEAFAERAQPVGELALLAALVDMGVPAAERRQRRAGCARSRADQTAEPRRLRGKARSAAARRRRRSAARAARSPSSWVRAPRPCAIGLARARRRRHKAGRRPRRRRGGRAAAAGRRRRRAAGWRPAACPAGCAAGSGRWLIASAGPRGPGSAASSRFIQPSGGRAAAPACRSRCRAARRNASGSGRASRRRGQRRDCLPATAASGRRAPDAARNGRRAASAPSGLPGWAIAIVGARR